MNKQIGMVGSAVNFLAVIGFALCMLIGTANGSYLICMFIAFSFIPMICAFCSSGSAEKKAAGYTAVAFAAVYTVFILAVYFAQISFVTFNNLNGLSAQILDYQKFGLFFNYDLLGYGIMAISTFFAGLSLKVTSRTEKWLKLLLMVHGCFFPVCFLVPMLGVFHPGMQGEEWIGTALLEFWCIYFAAVDLLAFSYFKKQK